jgi:hypothetical protein
VRPEAEAVAAPAAEPAAVTETAEPAVVSEESGDEPLVVSDFEAIDALLEQALPEVAAEVVPETPDPVSPPDPADAGEGLGEAG